MLNNKFLDEYNKAIDLFVPIVKLNGRLAGLELRKGKFKKNLEKGKRKKINTKPMKIKSLSESVNLKRQALAASKLVKKLIRLSRTKYEKLIIEKSKSQPKLLNNYMIYLFLF